MHILIVDDTSETRDLFQLCFIADGHTAETAHNGQEALRIVQESEDNLDLIIMDYHMWGMTGLEVVKQIRKRKKQPPIPVILYTADPNKKVEREAQKLGVDRVVQKPALPNEMIAMAEELVNAN
jgi:CheY-like chemotaxis protein